jgi:hypothetical protein
MEWRVKMNEKEMFEKSFERPSNYFQLDAREQWRIDEELGILDWKGEITKEDKERFEKHYN